jgi:hypothetical protein
LRTNGSGASILHGAKAAVTLLAPIGRCEFKAADHTAVTTRRVAVIPNKAGTALDAAI